MNTGGGYDIVAYRSGFASEVATLLKDFWGGDTPTRLAYLKWKYENTPYAANDPTAFVTFNKDRIVAFRGYFATRWHIPGEGFETDILSPGDTFVAPDHRREGLSVKMGLAAMTAFSRKYKVFLNLSATAPSVPGYRRMGFVPLAEKVYWNRYRLKGLFGMIANMSGMFAPTCRVYSGTFGNVQVADTPRPREMARLISEQRAGSRRLSLLQDELFFKWRFMNKKNTYAFYFVGSDEVLSAYLVVRITSGGRRGYIIDFSASDISGIESIIRVATERKHYDVLSVYDYCLSVDDRGFFKKLGFNNDGVLRFLERRKRGEWPLLVRPVNQRCRESDWVLAGKDIRTMENWHIKEICSDGV